jgi:DNA-binding beta-propeller fold protein YncE
MKKALALLTIIIASVNVYGTNYLWRLDEDGNVIDGPTAYDGTVMDNTELIVSEEDYVYVYDHLYFRCFDSDLNIVNTEEVYGVKESFSIDNVRNEIIAPGSIKRYGPTLELLEEFDVPSYPYWLTVDPSDGSIWYASAVQGEEGLYKVNRDGDSIYYFPDGCNGCLTAVSPQGSFWVSDIAPSYFEGIRLMESDGGITTEADVKLRYVIDMYLGDESCWFISNDPIGISKVNSSGSVVYSNPTDFDRPRDLAIDQSDGSVWIADTYNYNIVHLDQNGGELVRTDWDEELIAIAVDPTNDTIVVVSSPAHAAIEPTSVGRIKALFK